MTNTDRERPLRRIAYLDFDGVLFYSKDEPLFSSLLAFGHDVNPESINSAWLDRYQEEKHNIANQSDLYQFVTSLLDLNNYTGLDESQFRSRLLEVRESHVSSGIYRRLFEPTPFTHCLRSRLHCLELELCILTNRDGAISRALCSEYLRPDLRIETLGMLRMRKLSFIINDCGVAPCIFIDDVDSNLMASNLEIPSNLIRVHASWGYGKSQIFYNKDVNLLSADHAEAMAMLINLAELDQ